MKTLLLSFAISIAAVAAAHAGTGSCSADKKADTAKSSCSESSCSMEKKAVTAKSCCEGDKKDEKKDDKKKA